MERLDAQALAQDLLGDTVSSNIIALGYAWQRAGAGESGGAGSARSELNGVAVEVNWLVFSLGRPAVADPAAQNACAKAMPTKAPQPESLDRPSRAMWRTPPRTRTRPGAERFTKTVAAARVEQG